MLEYDYKYAILLDKLRNGGTFHFLLNLDTLYSGGGVKPHLPLDIFTSYIPCIEFFYITLMSYAIAYV